jgi:transcriptional regulator with XRE-family HTH domain
MREALAIHDLASVYRILQRYGVSQRRIAAAVEQSQSEISEILKGRQVGAYDVFVRIVEGFGIPRGWMGLAYDDETMAMVPDWLTSATGPPRARLLAASLLRKQPPSSCPQCLGLGRGAAVVDWRVDDQVLAGPTHVDQMPPAFARIPNDSAPVA